VTLAVGDLGTWEPGDLARVLLLATTTGYQTRAFGDAAQRLGVQLVFATDRCHLIDDPWQDAAIPIRFYDEDASVAAILDSARERSIDGILAVGDRPTVIAARVAAALGLPWHSVEGAAAARHKLRTRERLRDAGLPVPWFVATASGTEVDAPTSVPGAAYPCVLKPVALSGSRGVMRADDPVALAASFERLRALLRSPDIRAERNPAHAVAIVEGFIPGREYAVDAVMHHGALHVLAIFDKPDPLDGPFFEETIYVTPAAAPADVQQSIVGAVRRAAEALGLHHGPIHAECRVNDAGVFVLEVAARPIGGLCARALRFERIANPERVPTPDSRVPTPESLIPTPESLIPTPESLSPLEELLLRHALGESPAAWRRESTASGVMMIPIPRRGTLRGVDGIDAARAVPHVVDVSITAKLDQRLVPLPEGASYLGFIFARADAAADVDRALRAAHARLYFAIDPEFPVLAHEQIHYNLHHG
jgi:ATP-grasp domain-containing protein/L-aminoacid ligase-like protein